MLAVSLMSGEIAIGKGRTSGTSDREPGGRDSRHRFDNYLIGWVTFCKPSTLSRFCLFVKHNVGLGWP